jgi:hypothetical protein
MLAMKFQTCYSPIHDRHNEHMSDIRFSDLRIYYSEHTSPSFKLESVMPAKPLSQTQLH